jgi:hypothetical protein
MTEGAQRRPVSGHAVVTVVPEYNRAQVGAHLWDGIVQASLQLDSQRLELRLPPLAHRLLKHGETPLLGLHADMREAKKVEGLRLPVATFSSVLVREAAEFDEARLVGMQPKAEPLETLAELTPADASPPSSRTSAHGAGPAWVAIPSLSDSFIPFNSPV